MDFEQYFQSATRTRSVHHFGDLYLQDEKVTKAVRELVDDSLFSFWFITIGNGRNITGADVGDLPFGTLPYRYGFANLFDELMVDYQRHSTVRHRYDSEFQEFRPSESKAIIDEIDRVLAKHYGFTDETLDFIITTTSSIAWSGRGEVAH